MRRILFLLLLILPNLSLGAVEVFGVDIEGLEVHGGGFYILNAVADSAPDPIVNSVGVSIPFRFLSYFTFRPETQFFLQTYGFQQGRSVPLETMFDSVLFLTWMLNPALGVEFPLTPDFSVGAEVGVNFYNRFPIYFLGTGGSQALEATGWFYSGRFIYPTVGGHIVWQFSELFAVTLRTSLQYPLFNLWTNSPWYDQLALGLNMGLRFKL
jgi:hypothetical protein